MGNWRSMPSDNPSSTSVLFGTQVDNIRVDQLDQISAKATIPIQNLTRIIGL